MITSNLINNFLVKTKKALSKKRIKKNEEEKKKKKSCTRILKIIKMKSLPNLEIKNKNNFFPIKYVFSPKNFTNKKNINKKKLKTKKLFIFSKNKKTQSFITETQKNFFNKTSSILKKIDSHKFNFLTEIENKKNHIAKFTKYYNIKKKEYKNKIEKNFNVKKKNIIGYRIEINKNSFPIKIEYFPIVDLHMVCYVNDLPFEKNLENFKKYFLINSNDFENISKFKFFNLKIHILEDRNFFLKISFNKKSNLKIYEK